MAIATWSPDGKLGAVALKAAGLIAASATETAVEVGKGKFRAVSTITAIETASGDEQYIALIEANTRGATSTWYEIATLFARGASAATGRSAADVADAEEVIVDNPYDYQVRVRTYVVGSVSTGINYTVDAYTLLSKY